VRGQLLDAAPRALRAEVQALLAAHDDDTGRLERLPGAALAAVLVGLVRSAAVHYRPELDLFAIYFVMAVVLIMRPKGLFSVLEARKI